MLRRMVMVLALLAVAGVMGESVRAQDKKDKKKDAAGIALIKLKGDLSDGPASTPSPFSGAGGDTLRTMQERIDKAAKDGDVKALVLHMEGYSASWTDQNELRQTIANFRKSGKKA